MSREIERAGKTSAPVSSRSPPPRSKTPTRPPPQKTQSAEFFALTYGAIVRQLIMDYEDLEQVNKQLDTM